MNKKTISKTLCTWLLCIVMVGCDGGIFGTGDGGNIDLGPETADSDVPNDTLPIPPVVTPPAQEESDPLADPGDTGDNLPTPPVASPPVASPPVASPPVWLLHLRLHHQRKNLIL